MDAGAVDIGLDINGTGRLMGKPRGMKREYRRYRGSFSGEICLHGSILI